MPQTILIADGDSVEEAQLYSESGIQVARAQANYEALTAQINEICPALVMVSFRHDGLAIARLLLKKYPQLKILLSDAPDYRSLVEGLKAGACGAITVNTSATEKSFVINAALWECLLAGPSQATKYVVLPKPKRISRFEQWLDWVLYEAINYWRTENALDEGAISEFLKQLGVEVGKHTSFLGQLLQGKSVSLLEELNRVSQNFNAPSKEYHQTLSKYELVLEGWFFESYSHEESCLARIRNNAMSYRRLKVQQLHAALDLLPGGTYSLHNWLEKVCLRLQELGEGTERIKIEEYEREKSASQAYQVLLNKLSLEESRDDYQGALRALTERYKAKVNAEAAAAARQILAEIAEAIRTYQNLLNGSDRLLWEIQHFLEKRSSLPNAIFVSVWQEYVVKYIEAHTARQEIEQWLEKPVRYWQGISQEHLQSKMVEIVRPKALKLYFEYCSEMLI